VDAGASAKMLQHGLFAVRFDKAEPASSLGANFSTFKASHHSSVTDFTNYEKQKYIIEIEGLKDNGSGTITGSANAAMERPDHVAKFIYYKQNGDSTTGFDNTTHPGTLIASTVVDGKFDGRSSYRAMLGEVLQNHACKLYPARNGDLVFWPYTAMQSEVAVISEGDCSIVGMGIEDSTGIINSLKITYNRSAIPLDAAKYQDNINPNYQDQLIIDDVNAGGVWGPLRNESSDIYGEKYPQSDYIPLNTVADSAGAHRYAEYLLRNFTLEQFYVVIRVPFWRYRDIEEWSIVRISHVLLPSTLGAESTNKARLPTYAGATVTNFNFGFPWRRAKDYPSRVVARNPVVNVRSAEAELEFKLKIIDNPREIY